MVEIGRPATTAARQLTDSIIDELGTQLHEFPMRRVNGAFGGGLRPGEVTVLAGSVGSAKSYLSLMLCLSVHKSGSSWCYMPLEDSASYALRRMWALDKCDWSIMNFNQATAEERFTRSKDDAKLLSELQDGLINNPRTPVVMPNGKKLMPQLPWQIVAEWLSHAAEICSLIVIDPISMIDFADNKQRTQEWDGQQAFIQRTVAIAKSNKAHIWLVAHLAKRHGRCGPLTMDDVQGSTAFSRFADNVLLLSGHEPEKSRVLRYAECEGEVEHRRTLGIGKIRNGPGSGLRIALDFQSTGPVLHEFGVILPKKKRKDT